MPNCLLKWGFVITILVLFIGLSINPSLGMNIKDQFNLIDNEKEEVPVDVSIVDKYNLFSSRFLNIDEKHIILLL